MRLLNLTSVLFFIFWGTSTLFSIMTTPICIPTSRTELFLFSLPVFFSSYLVGNSQSNSCEVISDVVLIWISLMITDFNFSHICWPFVCPLWKNVYSGPLPILKIRLFVSFCFWVIWVPYIFWILILSDICFANIFSYCIGCLSILLMVSFDGQRLFSLM